MAGLYEVQWANGLAFQTFKLYSQIEIIGSAEEGYDGLEVYLINTNGYGGKAPVYDAESRDGHTIEFTLTPDVGEHQAVMTEWVDQNGDKALFGEIFIGDPDGAGGFGGQHSGSGFGPPNRED